MKAVIDGMEFRGIRSGEYEGRSFTSLTFEDADARQYRMSCAAEDSTRFAQMLQKGSLYTLEVAIQPFERSYRLRLLDVMEV